MHVSANQSDLILTIGDSLLPYQELQLRHFGAEENDGESFRITEYDINTLQQLIDYCTVEGIKYSLDQKVASVLSEKIEDDRSRSKLVKAAAEYKKGEFDVDKMDGVKKFLKKYIPRTLLEHQIKALYHLVLLGNAANFSVPGSGKTTVVLSYYEKLRLEAKVKAIVVIGPPACFGPWRDEFISVLGRKPMSRTLAGGNAANRKQLYRYHEDGVELYLTSFQTLQNDFQELIGLLNNMGNSVLLVVDEAHYMKQVDGKWANAVLATAPAAKFRCVLTGTPAPQGYRDFFNLFSFLWPENNPFSESDQLRLTEFEKQKRYDSARKLLEPRIGPLFYRVRKKDLNLKPQSLNVVEVEMNPVERKIYDAVIGRVKELTTHDYIRQADVLAALHRGRLMRLRQAVSDPRLLKTAIEGYTENVVPEAGDISNLITQYGGIEQPGKLVKLLELIEGYLEHGKKVVVWSNFLGTVSNIGKSLDERGIYYKKIIGETPVARDNVELEDTREQIREEFVDPASGLMVLIANPAACAESISLHKSCQNAIYYDMSYNCAQYLQSLDRIHRVGGSEDKPAYYDFLVYSRSVDRKILQNVQDKAERMSQLIDLDYAIYSLDMSGQTDDVILHEILDETKV